MRAKIGDYVKIKPGVVAIAGYTIGEPYEVRATEIIGVDSSNVRLYRYQGKRQWFGPDEYEIVEVTPKVGDIIRATRGETVISGTVEYVASSSYAPASGNFSVRLDGEPESFFWVQKDDGFTVEIIKPKVVLPTGKFAVIKLSGMFPHFLTEGKGWLQTTTQTSAKSYFTDEEILKKMESEGRTLEILFEGVDIPQYS